ncbi:glycine zipper 2TM domain-containing protein [Alishewanella jeotgali]|uniref:Outer membrane lipoprotein n=1 Tax=Alishewanella jeotgali KCTC 22429 TaxID=1129374 RepID=H3ZB58_9ALTE|nr:glycine zipper 2TM domain-containing protein [Alishewanella jeotgali]EHR42172.1 outer membrane lipoprotein [Alishewanella jeotgali KCTC 22429]
MKQLCYAITLAGLTLSSTVHAHGRSEYGRVTDVVPVYSQVPVRHVTQSCTSHYQRGGDSSTPAIVGAIVGGALGHAVGNNKSNKRIGLVAGAALGGSVGYDLGKKDRYYEDCRPHHNSVQYRQVLQGYQVTYKYRGRYYQTFTEQHPGRTIPLVVSARPAYRY